jgi:hypothetical protein
LGSGEDGMDDLQTRKHNFLIAVGLPMNGPASRSMLGVQFSIFELREARTFQTATAIINATAGALTVILAVQSEEEMRPCLKEVGNFQLCCTSRR